MASDKHWTPEEELKIIGLYPRRDFGEIAERLDRSPWGVYHKWREVMLGERNRIALTVSELAQKMGVTRGIMQRHVREGTFGKAWRLPKVPCSDRGARAVKLERVYQLLEDPLFFSLFDVTKIVDADLREHLLWAMEDHDVYVNTDGIVEYLADNDLIVSPITVASWMKYKLLPGVKVPIYKGQQWLSPRPLFEVWGKAYLKHGFPSWAAQSIVGVNVEEFDKKWAAPWRDPWNKSMVGTTFEF